MGSLRGNLVKPAAVNAAGEDVNGAVVAWVVVDAGIPRNSDCVVHMHISFLFGPGPR